MKYREKGLGRNAWLKGDIETAKQYIAERNTETLRGPEIKPVNTNQCVPENQYLSEVQELNERHAVVMLGGKCLVINETVDPIFNREPVACQGFLTLCQCGREETVTGPSSRQRTCHGVNSFPHTRQRYPGLNRAFIPCFVAMCAEPQRGQRSRSELSPAMCGVRRSSGSP